MSAALARGPNGLRRSYADGLLLSPRLRQAAAGVGVLGVDAQRPAEVLGGGVAVGVVAAFVRDRRLPDALTHVALDLVIGTLLMLVGLLLAARARAIDLGGFWTAVLKLAAISVAPAAAADLLAPLFAFIPLGGLVLLVVQFVVYFALIGALFDLDQSDTWYCVCVIFLVRLAVYFTLMYAL